jgi:hypothetical protein
MADLHTKKIIDNIRGKSRPMADPTFCIAPSPDELEAFNAACERAGRHFAERVRQVERDLIYELLKQPRQARQREEQAND